MLKRCSLVGLASVWAIVACFFANAQGTEGIAQRVAIRAARLIDGKSEVTVRNGVVLVEGQKITAVGSGLEIPPDAKVIDLGDATLLPGLIDAHTHLLSEMDGTNVTLQ